MKDHYKTRKCRRCKQIKLVNVENFGVQKSLASYNRTCNQCKNKDNKKSEKVVLTCKEPSCSNTFIPTRVTQVFCSVKCRYLYHENKTLMDRREESKEMKGKKIKIPSKFLDRGRITYEGYTTL